MTKLPQTQQQYQQDLRSLALFRILLGLYIVYDVISRLKHGRLSLLWYTSSPESFMDPNDTPHKSPIHQIWFYRGSELVQLTLLASTASLALLFAVGHRWCNNATSKTLLWASVTAMQCRNMHVHDGSDTYVRHLLLWSCQIPELSNMWSLNPAKRELNKNHHTTTTRTTQSTSQQQQQQRSSQHQTSSNIDAMTPAIWGLRLQIVLMYVGTILNRTTDLYGWSNIQTSMWMPPKLLAVHYSLNSSFATRDSWLGDLIRTTLPLSQVMTCCAMVIEGVASLVCLVLGNRAITIVPAALLGSLHFGLLILINLPNWQFAGMLATSVWIPTAFWDRWLSQQAVDDATANRKKDDDLVTEDDDDREEQERTIQRQSPNQRRRPYVTYFFLAYMVYNFCGERRWISKHDGGDIGEFLRFSQYWVMFGTPPVTSVHTILVGTVTASPAGDDDDDDDDQEDADQQVVDVWEWIKSDHIMIPMDLEQRQFQIWSNMTHVYPSPRWERIFDQWGQRKDRTRARYFMTQLCRYSNGTFQTLTLVWQHFRVMPPNGNNIRNQRSGPDTVLKVNCPIE